MTRSAGGLDLVVSALSCPLCRAGFSRTGSSLVCAHHHSFDIARQGYVSLFGGGRRANTGDDVDMVAARARFLERGHYAPIADALDEAVTDALCSDSAAASSRLLVDLAGGTGYYLARIVQRHPELVGVSIDLSAAASRRAALAHERIAAVTADVWQRLPLAEASCRVALSVFGPRNGSEIARVLCDHGALIVVSPTPRHLTEIIGPLGLITVDPRKRDRLDERLSGLRRRSTRKIEYRVDMTRTDIADDVAMGPSSHHLDRLVTADRVSAMAEITTVSISVEISVWTPLTKQSVDESHNVTP